MRRWWNGSVGNTGPNPWTWNFLSRSTALSGVPCRRSGLFRGVCAAKVCSWRSPGRVRGEGLFLAVVRKPGQWEPRERCADNAASRRERKGASKRKRGVKAPEIPSEVRAWITPGERENFPLTATENGLRAFPAQWSDLLSLFLKKLQVISAGTELAETRGHDVVPAQALALSTLLDADAFPRVETDRETALAYLRREAVALPRETPRGFVLLTYGGRPLGFVKNLGNRANNLYPKEWRIKSIQKS